MIATIFNKQTGLDVWQDKVYGRTRSRAGHGLGQDNLLDRRRSRAFSHIYSNSTSNPVGRENTDPSH